jgi:hypothetical protein
MSDTYFANRYPTQDFESEKSRSRSTRSQFVGILKQVIGIPDVNGCIQGISQINPGGLILGDSAHIENCRALQSSSAALILAGSKGNSAESRDST